VKLGKVGILSEMVSNSLFNKLRVLSVQQRGLFIIATLTVFIGIAALSYFTGKNTLMRNTFLNVTPYPTVSQEYTSVTQVPPSVRGIPRDLQKCLDEIATKRDNIYKEFCDRWKVTNNSEDCPGMDEIDDPFKECYVKFGYPTTTPPKLLFRGTSETVTCPAGYSKTCEKGICECY